MTEQNEPVTAFGYVARMWQLLTDARASLEYVIMEEPEGLSEDEELVAALEQLLACLDKWTLPLQESRAKAARAQQIAQRLMAAADGRVADLEDEQIKAALLMLERRQGELGENTPF